MFSVVLLFSLSLVSVLSLHSHFILHTCSPHSYRILFSHSLLSPCTHNDPTLFSPTSHRDLDESSQCVFAPSVCVLAISRYNILEVFLPCARRFLCILLTVRTPMRQRARVQRPVAPDFAHCHAPCPHRAAPCGALFCRRPVSDDDVKNDDDAMAT